MNVVPVFLRITRRRRFLIPLLVSLACLWTTPTSASEKERPARIVILHSYHEGFSWTDGVTSGIREALKGEPVEIFSEYLDSKRHRLEEIQDSATDQLKAKYASQPPDLVILCDNHALELLRHHRDSLFLDVPIVFCGINNYLPEWRKGFEDRMTGVVEKVDPEGTVRLIRQLQPETRRLILISGTSTTAQEVKKEVEKALAESNYDFEPIWWNGLATKELCDRLQKVDEDDAVLLILFNRDKNGQYFSFEESARLVSSRSAAPVYGMWDFYLGNGVVGGMMASSKDQGWTAGKLAEQILRTGNLPPVVTTSPNRPIFKYSALVDHQLDPEYLPEEAEIVGQPHKSRWALLVITAFSSLIIATAFIVLLKTVLAQRKHHGHSLADQVKWNLRGGVVILLLSLLAAFVVQSWFSYQEEAERVRRQVLQEKKTLIVTMVRHAMDKIRWMRSDLSKSGLSEPEIKRRVKQRLGEFSFAEGEGYIFVIDFDGVYLVNRTQRELIGKNLYEFTDSEGVPLVKELIDVAKLPEGGFVSYHWEKPSSEKTTEKLSYAEGVQDWRWVVGSGLYLDDVDAAVHQAMLRTWQSLLQEVAMILSVGLVVLMGMIVVSKRTARKIGMELQRLTHGIAHEKNRKKYLDHNHYRIREFRMIAQDVAKTFDALKKSYSQIQEVSESITDILWSYRLDGEGNFIEESITEQVDDYLELPKGTINNSFQSYMSFIHPDDFVLVMEKFRKGIQNPGTIEEYEYRLQLPGGRIKWVQSRGIAEKLPDGSIKAFGRTTDISRQKEFEKELMEKEQRLSLALEGGKLGTWDWNLLNDVVHFNAYWAEMKGYAPEEIEPHVNSWEKLVHPDDLQQVREKLQKHFDGETEAYEAEFRMRRSSGEWMWILDRGKVIERDGDGKPIRACGTHSDISEHVRAEKDLAEQTRLMKTILDGIPDVVVLQNLDHRIIAYNKAGHEMIGKSSKEMEGEKCFTLLGKKYPCRDCPASLALEQKQIISRERYMPDENRWIRTTSIPVLDTEGNPKMMVEQFQDITEQKHSQRELQSVIKALEEANRDLQHLSAKANDSTRAKSEFLANMSHEIRTPMTAILGFAELLMGEPGLEKAPKERVEAIRTIQRNGKYLLGLINEILDLSKIEAGKLEIESTDCDPLQVLSEVNSLMWKKAEGKNLPVRFECDGPIPERIQSDPMRLKQILINLIGNAIKFTESGSVRVVTRCIKRGSGKSHLQFEVIDTGIGMTEKQLERLFQPFSQADSSTTRQFGGTGLGLTISKRLTEALGGSLSVDSVLNQGSTFTVAVATGPLDGVRMIEKTEPLSAEPSSPPLEDGVGMMPLLNGRILLAEDGPDNQRLLGFVLRKSGAEVTIANNGEEACRIAWEEKVGGHPFDLVLMDMQMPVMDGYTATETLRRRGFEGPILALTAHAMDGCEAKCRKAGCDGYLTKPIERKHFLETITGFLTESRSGMDPHPPK